MIEVSFARFKLNRDRKTFDCLFEVPLAIERDPLIVVGECVLGLNLYRCGVVTYRLLKLRKFIIGETTVEQRLEMVWEYF
jgi:hypothetical protein